MFSYDSLVQKSLAGDCLSQEDCEAILTSSEVRLLPLLDAAYQVRKTYWNNDVTVHVINNAQNGNCPEDCAYCAQAKSSTSDIEDYPLKSEAEILEEARQAHESGAHRYCMVFAGRGPRPKRVDQLADLIKKIKDTYPIQVCLSAGLIDDGAAKQLKQAGLDRLNHNLNTSEERYASICSTHTYQDRLNTLKAAQDNGLEMCSGMIAGMGETPQEVIKVALALRDKQVSSIPINFLIPIEGTRLTTFTPLNPEYCLRILCLFRFLNPKAEIRVAAGREVHLRSMQVMALYPASSLFMAGYLNTMGTDTAQTLQMIKDAGFTIRSDFNLDDILEKAKQQEQAPQNSEVIMKQLKDLRPAMKSCS